MNRKTIKIITTVLAIILLIGAIAPIVMAAETAADAGAIMPGNIKEQYSGSNKDILEIAGRIMGFIRNIAVVGGVIMLMILGVKYMIGSAEEKAGYQKSLLPLVIGILIVMSASVIMTFVINMFTVSSGG